MSDVNPSSDGPDLPQLGSYRIVRQLGSGGMSNVFEAIHTGSGSLVALKVLPRKLARNAVLLQRFLREARNAESLDHPNIVAIYDRGFDQGRHYLVLEHVEGKDLFDRVRNKGPLTAPEAVKFVREVALGLEYAAKRGMIHRDIKPANLLIASEGHAKIIDLGLALMTEEDDERVTRDGTTVGTVDYMSPEQARDSRKINERSDIYSLGCTLHYLLTGFPPYPGGNLADKLARHHSADIPDVRDRKPDVPRDLAVLVRRMMAKKPEQRFANYPELIAALDQIGVSDDRLVAPGLADVLIDDDENDDFVELTAVAPPPHRPDARPKSHSAHTHPSRPEKPSPKSSPAEVSLEELAALDQDDAPVAPRRRAPATVGANPRSSAIVEALLEEGDEASDAMSVRRIHDELPLKTWIAAGIMVGLLIAVVAFGVRFALTFLATTPAAQVVSNPIEEQPETAHTERSSTGESGTYPKRVPPALTPTAIRKTRELIGPPAPTIAQPEILAGSLTETAFDPDIMARLGFGKVSGAAAIYPTAKVVVRRLVESGESSQTSSLANAFGRLSDTVELADVGPFHEDDCQLAGKSRIIRGRAGLRSILKIEATWQPLVRDQEAKFSLGLGGVEQLLLERIDIVVDVRDLPVNQSTLFLCQGTDLTLRDCSITITNADDRRTSFSVFRLAPGPRPNRLQLDRCLIRGPIQSLVQIVSSNAEVSLDRSVVIGSEDSLFKVEPVESPQRRVLLCRSLLVSQAPILSWSGKPTPMSLRSLGTTFAHAASPTATPLWQARQMDSTDVRAWLDYDGEANSFLGWAALAQWGSAPIQSSSVPSNIRSIWSTADRTSQSASTSWPAASIAEATTALDYRDLLPAFGATLTMVAMPHPDLLKLTVDQFPRLAAPKLLDDLTSGTQALASKPPVLLTFDAQAGRQADLGLFLKTEITDPTKRYLVRILGATNQTITPVRLPDGVSVVISGPGGEGTNNPVPVFFAATPGLALIEIHAGDLALANVGFASAGAVRTNHWIYAEDSVVALRRCRYRDLGQGAEIEDSAAIAFVARGNTPIPLRVGGFQTGSTRPILSMLDCWIWTGGAAIAAEVTQGIVELKNSLIAAGPAAFRLRPTASQPTDLKADLILENCTVIDERVGVELSLGSATNLGGARPWLVGSRFCVFPRNWRKGESLLAIDPFILAQGAVFWQSSNDLYEVGRFLGPLRSSANPSAQVADLKRHWIDLWGLNHTRGDRGPDARKPERILHFRDKDLSRTSRPTPLQLELDPKSHSGQGVNLKVIPPMPRA